MFRVGAVVFALFALCGQAWAQFEQQFEPSVYANVYNWTISPDNVGGCFAAVSYKDGGTFRVGVNRPSRRGSFVLYNPAWRSLTLGYNYELTFAFDDGTQWGGTFTARSLDGMTVLVNYFSNPSFLETISARHWIEISYGKNFVTNLGLTGSRAALLSVVECQKRIDMFGSGSARDPFANQFRP